MKVQVRVDRGMAIKAGSDEYGDVVVDLDLTQLSDEQRSAVAAAPERNGVTDLTGSAMTGEPPTPRLAKADPIPWVNWLVERDAARKAKLEREQAENAKAADKYIDHALSAPIGAWVKQEFDGVYRVVNPGADPSFRVGSESAKRIREALQERRQEAVAEVERLNQQRKERLVEMEREKAAQEEERKRQIDEWVAGHMTPIDGERHAEGLLPQEEVLASMRNHVFAPLDDLQRYQRIKSSDLEHDDDCLRDDSMTCDADTPDSLDNETYAQLKQVREMASSIGGKTQPRYHTCECDYCSAETTRYSALITVQFGAFTFSREYALS